MWMVSHVLLLILLSTGEGLQHSWLLLSGFLLLAWLLSMSGLISLAVKARALHHRTEPTQQGPAGRIMAPMGTREISSYLALLIIAGMFGRLAFNGKLAIHPTTTTTCPTGQEAGFEMRKQKTAAPPEQDFQPLGDRVLVQRLPKDGILDSPKLADHAGTDMVQAEGLVLKAGPGKTDEDGFIRPMGVKAGDRVLFNARWNDFRAAELTGSDCDRKGPLERPLPAGHPKDLYLITEGDIAGILS